MTESSITDDTRRGTRGPVGSSKTTLADVARRAGVSRATASRALAGRSEKQPASHARVLAAAEELGYVVNGLARSMMGVGRRSIAFVSSVMVGPTFAAMASGAEEIATANDHLFMLCTTNGHAQREQEVIDSLGEQRADAVLLVGSSPTDEDFAERAAGYAAKLALVGAQLILCGRAPLPDHPEIASVDYDHAGGVRSAVEHLVSLGHRRIGYVGEIDEMSSARARFRGYRDGLEHAGITFDEAVVVPTSNDTDHTATVLHAYHPSHPDVTAYVCQTDLIAIGVCRALRASGNAVPADVSVVGFDDMPLVADLTPALTTVRVPFHRVGVLAGEIAVGEPYAGPIVLSTTLIIRDSTGPAPLR